MSKSKSLYNADLAPTPAEQKKWGGFEIFYGCADDVQDSCGCTLG